MKMNSLHPLTLTHGQLQIITCRWLQIVRQCFSSKRAACRDGDAAACPGKRLLRPCLHSLTPTAHFQQLDAQPSEESAPRLCCRRLWEISEQLSSLRHTRCQQPNRGTS